MRKGQCIKTIQETRNRSTRKKTLLGVTISGSVLMALALLAGIAVYWKKLAGTKKRFNEGQQITLSVLTKRNI